MGKRKDEEVENPESCLNRAEPGEPIFVLLGRDKSAPKTVRRWANHRVNSGKNQDQDPKIKEAREWADYAERWRKGKE